MTVEKRGIDSFFKPQKRQKVESVVASGGDAKREPEMAAKRAKPAYKSRKEATEDAKSESPFNKDEFVASLSAEQLELLELELDTMDASWLAVLHDEITKPYFLELKRFLRTEWSGSTAIFPPKKDIYSWTVLTPFDQVRVLIIGQDPYHNFNQAHGLAFSVKDPQTRVPPSLVNIYKGVKIDYDQFAIPKTGDLTKWAQQGVLMLNTCLTVRAHQANSHAKRGWEQFTRAVVGKLLLSRRADESSGIVVIAWGAPALKMVQSVPGTVDWTRNLLLKSAHPSPLSARRGFFDGNHFRKTNEWLETRFGNDATIDWAIQEGNSTRI